jgi:hypothetical protein
VVLVGLECSIAASGGTDVQNAWLDDGRWLLVETGPQRQPEAARRRSAVPRSPGVPVDDDCVRNLLVVPSQRALGRAPAARPVSRPSVWRECSRCHRWWKPCWRPGAEQSAAQPRAGEHEVAVALVRRRAWALGAAQIGREVVPGLHSGEEAATRQPSTSLVGSG